MFGRLRRSLKSVKNALKKIIVKIRIFKRLKEYKGTIRAMKHALLLANNRIAFQDDELRSLGEALRADKRAFEEALKITDELKKRRDEFIRRMSMKIPDDILSGGLKAFKYWLAEPFIVENFEPESLPDKRQTYIDGVSALKGLLGLIKQVKNNGKEEVKKGTEEGSGTEKEE